MTDRRRSNGEGTDIVLGGDGRYHTWLSMGVKSGGKRDRRHVSGPTRKVVAEKVRALQAKRDAGYRGMVRCRIGPAVGHRV